jgi:Tfp pilus assembly protein FimT
MRSFIQHDRVVSQANGIIADLQYARLQAVASHGYVSICPLSTANGSTCDTSDGSYAQGWMIFTTSALNTAYNSASNTLLRVQAAPSTTTVSASSKGILTYDSFGQLWSQGSPSGQLIAVSYSVCTMSSSGTGSSTHQVPGSQINITASGRVVSTTLPAGAACSS